MIFITDEQESNGDSGSSEGYTEKMWTNHKHNAKSHESNNLCES